ncbi:hypothetical protein E2986_06444 [Frieseomelitta varia]|uniref:UBA domain-containing protein n=2 Tax=Frieseomelitta varia TaxID=561572 RepID=A0A833W0X5_9HYME|nr:hypothetical protein E2986_06444 [Frieseomelitta varia]
MSTSNLFLNIISPEGMITSFSVTSDMTVGTVKTIAIKHFYDDDISKNPINFRLIHTSKFMQLLDDHKITCVEIHENDELMLINIRPKFIDENLSDDALKGPNKEVILQVTKDLPTHNPIKYIPCLYYHTDFQYELRKILITLVRASAKVILYNSETQKLYDILKEKLKCKTDIDPNAIKIITEMGYSKKKVLKALYLQKSNITEALEWLTEHQNDPEDDNDDEYFDFMSTEEEVYENLEKEENIPSIVDRLLKHYRQCRKIDFKPDLKILQSLLEMGFEKKNIVQALKITENNQVNACEWLLGESKHNLQNLGPELDSDSSIYKAIMNDPHIQLSLTDPNMFLAYLSLLESSALNERIRDPEVKPIMDDIISVYNTEKPSVHINQYATSF